MKKITLLLGTLCLLLTLPATADDFVYNDLYAGPGAGTELPDFARWHYFGFDEHTLVLRGTSAFELIPTGSPGLGTEKINPEWAARTDWDFAFHAYDLRTNSGIAGTGGAGAIFIADSSSDIPLDELYAALTAAPDTLYPADVVASGTFYQSLATMPPPRATSLSVSAATRKALEGTTGASADFSSLSMAGGSGENPMIILLKTTKGEYVKIYLKQFISKGSAEATNSISVATENISVATENISVTTENISVATENISVTTENFSVTTENFSVATENISVTTENFSVTTENFSVVTENFSDEAKNFSDEAKNRSTAASNSLSLRASEDAGRPGYLVLEYAFIPRRPTGVAEVATTAVSVYPNPATEVMHVRLAEAAEVAVYHPAGGRVKSVSLAAGVHTLPVTGWAKGVYLIQITSQQQSVTQRVLVK
jgi:hypothetical protein